MGGYMEVHILQIYCDKPVLGLNLLHNLFECKYYELKFFNPAV